MPARTLFNHGIIALFQRWSSARKWPSARSLQWSCYPLFVCICMLNNWHVTNRQTICKHAKTTEAQQKEHTDTEQHRQYMQSHSKHTSHTNSIFFCRYQGSPLATRSAGELQIQIHLAALSGCCKLELSILTLTRANEQHSHVLSKESQTGGNIHSSHSPAVFHRRTDAKYSAVISATLTRPIQENVILFTTCITSKTGKGHF